MSMNRKAASHTFLLIWFGLAAIFIGSHWSFYFLQEHFEVGDFAANALQIRNAKSFHELYGNYSRWGFHHPGPAFFYLYAAGEFLLRDVLRAVPSPFSAHLLVGVLIQTGFFAWTLSILHRRVRHPLLVPLLLVFAALHFGTVNYNIRDSAFESIWPPHVLLFPFLCFLVACASMASGSAEDILPAVVSGCLLVHGNVAQTLFVGPLFLLGCFGLAGAANPGRHSLWALTRNHRKRLLAVGLVMVVFLLPIGLDVIRGEKSNLHKILRHLTTHSGDHKTMLQSITYLGTFLCYEKEPEQFCDKLTGSSLRFLTERWYFTGAWACTFAIIALAARQVTAKNHFVRWLYFYFGSALILTLYWGILQNKEMFNFNSYFNFGLLFIAIVLMVIAVCSWLRASVLSRAGPVLYLVALPLFWGTARSWHFDREFPDAGDSVTRFPDLKERAKTDSNPRKLLVFEHEQWPWAVGLALALERLGFDYAVSPDWGFMFGYDHVVDIVSGTFEKHLPIWTVGAPASNRKGFTIAGPGGPFVATTPPLLDPAAADLRFYGKEANAGEYVVGGWDLSDGPFSWSTAKVAVISFQPKHANADVEINMDIFPATFPSVSYQRVTISFNGHFSQTREMTGRSSVKLRIPMESWNQVNSAILSFEFPDSVSPRSLGVSSDPRTLGFGFTVITFREIN
jgi:hypothetical protein